MSARPDAPGPEWSRPHPVADVLLALLLLAADAVVAVVALLWSMSAAGHRSFGGGETDAGFAPVAVTLALVAALVLGTAFLAGRGKAYVTAVVQALAGLALLVVTGVAQGEWSRRDHPPAPGPGHSAPHAQCPSGGDDGGCDGS
ncbi:DUF6234 family protein [Streptomyces sp. NPDC052701]|uniref:DUF6234 family protein n=1 Tax=Streptomyces sp. NPDC052701 TaxID=3155533 RepID=UPI00343B7233